MTFRSDEPRQANEVGAHVARTLRYAGTSAAARVTEGPDSQRRALRFPQPTARARPLARTAFGRAGPTAARRRRARGRTRPSIRSTQQPSRRVKATPTTSAEAETVRARLTSKLSPPKRRSSSATREARAINSSSVGVNATILHSLHLAHIPLRRMEHLWRPAGADDGNRTQPR